MSKVKKLKKKCCQKYCKKGKACSRCPLFPKGCAPKKKLKKSAKKQDKKSKKNTGKKKK